MSCSPESTTPSRVRCSEPRESSSEPVPVEALGRAPFFVYGVSASIFARSISPWPWARCEQPPQGRTCALLRNRYFSVSGSIEGYRWMASAAAPATIAPPSRIGRVDVRVGDLQALEVRPGGDDVDVP